MSAVCPSFSWNEYKTLTALTQAARVEREENSLPYNTLLRMGSKRVEEELIWIWGLEGIEVDLNPEKTSDRIEKLLEASRSAECICDGQWIPAADRLLHFQGVDSLWFRRLILRALKLGRKKEHNVIVTGSPDGGKSFVFKPLSEIYDAFITRGQNESFPLQGIHGKELCLLQDPRYESFGIQWDEWLRWGEGETITVKMPRNRFAQSLPYKGSAPLFATMADLFSFPIREAERTGRSIEKENVQWQSRWTIVSFSKPIPVEHRCTTIEACPKCAALWYGSALDEAALAPLIEEPWEEHGLGTSAKRARLELSLRSAPSGGVRRQKSNGDSGAAAAVAVCLPCFDCEDDLFPAQDEDEE